MTRKRHTEEQIIAVLMVVPKAKRAAAQWVAERFGLSQRRVCRLTLLDRNTLRYRSRRQEDTALWTRIRELAESKRCYGRPRIYLPLRREGWPVNYKKAPAADCDTGGCSDRAGLSGTPVAD